MKLQNKYNYDSTLIGLNNIYATVGDNSFYLNSKCIQAYRDHTITTGRTYQLVWYLPIGGVELQKVKLVDVYCDNVRINIDLSDALTQKRFTISYNFRVEISQCPWKLFDLSAWEIEANLFEIEEYCGC